MANKKITELPELTSIADNDLLYVVDVSDLTESADGTSKKIRKSNIAQGGVELIANKQNSLAVDGTGVKYPTVDTINAEVVKLTGNQTIAGTKTFSVDSFINGIRLGKGNNSLFENTVFGLASGDLITTGDNNTFIGFASGQVVSTGSTNSFFGNSAGRKTTTGGSNTFVGGNSGFENTSGTGNNFVGGAAGYLNTIGSNNTYIGLGTGWYIADGVTGNTNSNNSVLIGNSARVLADNQTNQIVIGQAAIGLGSNSVVIGNADTVVSNIKGRLLLGTTTNNGIDQLQVNGTVNLTTPTTSAGGYDILTRNSTSGQVEKIASASLGDMTLGTAQTFTGTKTFNVAAVATPALEIGNNIAGNSYGININNSNSGTGIRIYGNASGKGISSDAIGGYGFYSSVGAGEGFSAVITGGIGFRAINNATGFNYGFFSSNNSTAYGIYSVNGSTGTGFWSSNSSTGTGILSTNQSSGIGLRLENSTAATGKPFQYTKNSVEKAFINDAGDFSAQKIISNDVVRLKNYTVATLPAGTQGDTAYVTDALAPTYMTTIVGGGAVVTPVFYNGTNWVAN